MNPQLTLMRILKTLLPALLLFLSVTAISQSKNPYKSIGKKGETLTLTKGEYDEFFDEDSIQHIGTALVNVRTLKVVKLLSSKGAKQRLENEKGSRFLSVDPIASSYPELTPYQFASNTPIWAIDIDGLEGGIAAPMGGQNVVDVQTAKDFGNYFKQPAARWMKIGLAYQMNANQSVHKYTEKSFPNLTVGEYYAASMGQSLINHSQPTQSEFTTRGTRTPQQPHVEVETNKAKPKQAVVTHEEVVVNTNKQTATGNRTSVQEPIQNQVTDYYRGGNSFTVKDRDIKVDPQTGLVKTTHGLSIHTEAEKMEKFGGAFKIVHLPNELQIIQRGNDKNHFEIVPKQQMSREDFQKYLNQIKTERATADKSGSNGN